MAMSFKDHQDTVLHLIGDSTGATREKVKRWINNAYGILWEQVYGDYKETVDYMATTIAYSTGTVAVAAGGTAVTGTGTAWDTTWTRRYIQFSGSGAWYRIASVDSTTGLTLEDGYVGTAALTAATYEIHTYLWPMPATVQRIIQVVAETQELSTPLDFVDRTAVFKERSQPLEWDTGTPWCCWIDEEDANGVAYLGISPVPTAATLINVRFQKLITELSADDDTSEIPGADEAIKAYAYTEALTYKARINEMGFWSQRYEVERDRLLQTVTRGMTTRFRHADTTSAVSPGTSVNLGSNWPRRR